MAKERVEFFGSFIDPMTMDETIEKIKDIIKIKKITQHVVVNVAKLVMMQSDIELRDAVNSCGIINADGAGIVFGSKLLGIKIPERVAGIDLMERLMKTAAEAGYKIYFFGAEENIVKEVIRQVSFKYSRLKIAGYRNGYFKESDEQKIVEDIKKSGADILFVGIPSPKKEKFLNRNLNKMNVPFVMGVGGSFDVIAGKTKRAPLWMQKIGLEWFYRFLQEPGRMWKRYLVTNTKYLFMLTKKLGESILFSK
ncbi:WecB/TagA/CpsF family glycosyltransferase [Candidatus Omnitrophus magneticus]|uniref:WecB/TagA/CpsF family glycosyltransferase n=1 Tax=Candidatus Omnitrophus magneticus TaxID=1609969 RepID=A0A0F0CTQ5_9BACT|nr:WecB/TagA/CpsF family glycosyltransferase [Candidatus Omnitrophus magneticus]